MDLCDDVDTHLARTIPRICATNKFDAQIHGNVRRCGAGLAIVIIVLVKSKPRSPTRIYNGKKKFQAINSFDRFNVSLAAIFLEETQNKDK